MQLKKGFQTNVGIVETVIAGIIVAAILGITKFVVKSNGISQLPSQIVSNSLLVDNQDELYRKLRLFGFCYAMNGGYKRWNPYRERHLAIFVNYF